MIKDYDIVETIQTGLRATVCKGKKRDDGMPVIIEIPNINSATNENQKKLIHDFEIGKILAGKGLCPYLELASCTNGKALVMQDRGTETLDQYRKGHILTLAENLEIAFRIASRISELHSNAIIHKNLNANTIVIHPDTLDIQFVDFRIAGHIENGIPLAVNMDNIEGRLSHMSPEQTGRMNRALDYRTDFYSLGVTFYEWFTGRLPFESEDPMELIHCHIAKKPVLLTDINPLIPKVVSDIIMKLMAKSPEDRYQSAQGLMADLDHCRKQIHATGQIIPFALGGQDRSEYFFVSEKLYGRSGESRQLADILKRVCKGRRQIVFVKGASGIGKSLLVNNLQKTVTLHHGYFIAGKYDQLNTHIAYGAIISAFQNLIGQILGETADQISKWKQELQAALKSNARVLIDLIPDIETIMGPQPPVADLGPKETFNRFKMVFHAFIKIFARTSHPLVIFIDDLQWADPAAFHLLKQLITIEEEMALYLIGAYRDDEVGPSHLLSKMLEQIEHAGPAITHIHLAPLDVEAVDHWIADSLGCPLSRSRVLTELVYQKTAGNPFFVKSFLHSLKVNELIKQAGPNEWQWDLAGIRQLQTTDNVAELLLNTLHQLPPETLDIVQTAACLGTTTPLPILARSCAKDDDLILKTLQPAFSSGVLLPANKSVAFAHDRIKASAYSLLSEERRISRHLKIGERLLAGWDKKSGEELIFVISDHLFRGRRLIKDPKKRVDLAKLNFQAALKAKNTLAYQTAEHYLEKALALLAQDTWETSYAFTFALHKQITVIAYLTGNFEKAEANYPLLLRRARSNLDKADVYIIQLEQYQLLGKHEEALATGKAALALFDISIPDAKEALRAFINREKIKIDTAKHGRSVKDIADGPKLTDPIQSRIMLIINNMMLPAFFSGRQLIQGALAALMTRLSLTRGNSHLSPLGYIGYGWFLAAVQNEIKQGEAFGRVGMAVMRRFDDKSMASRALSLDQVFLSHWREHIRHKIPNFLTGFQWALESGDQQYQSVNLYWKSATLFLQGDNLDAVCADALASYDHMVRTGSAIQYIFLPGIIQAILNLQGRTQKTSSLDSERFSEEQWLNQYGSVPIIKAWLYSAKIRACYLFGHYDDVLELFHIFPEADAELATHQVLHAELYMYNALTLTALFAEADDSLQNEWMERLGQWSAKMKNWADICPVNFSPYYLLVRAETARIKGHVSVAMADFEQAIEAARQNGFIQLEALAHELYARFWLNRTNRLIGQTYLQAAIRLYAQWGARAKVADLQTKYPDLLNGIKRESADNRAVGVDDVIRESALGLDLATIIKATQAISSEIDLQQLLSRIMQIIIENAGAEKGFLIQESTGQLFIEACAFGNPNGISDFRSLPIEESHWLSEKIVRQVHRTGNHLVLHNASADPIYSHDPYIRDNGVKSLLCIQIQYKNKNYGVLYLENNLTPHVFGKRQIDLLQVLLTQAAISIDNATLFKNLALSEAKWRTLVETTTDWLWETDHQGIYTYSSPQVKTILGYQPEELIGKTIFDLMPDDERHRISKKFQSAVFRKKAITSLENTCLHKDGHFVILETNGTPILDSTGALIGYRGIDRDISERKRAEKERERLATIIEATSDFIAMATPDEKVTYINSGGRRLLGLSSDQPLPDMRIADRHPADVYESIKHEGIPTAIREGVWKREAQLLNFASQPIPVSMVLMAHKSAQGQLEHVSTIIRDISEQKKNESEKLALERKLFESQKLESLGVLAGGIAHDFNNLLTGVLGNAELVLMDLNPESPVLPQVMDIRTSAIRLSELTNQMLAYSGKGQFFTGPIHLSAMVEEMAHLLKVSVSKKVTIEYHLGKAIPQIMADPTQIRQIIMNLITNASEAIDDQNGIVTLTTGVALIDRHELNTTYSNTQLKEGRYVFLEVSDTGRGMTKEIIDKIFDPFFTTKFTGRGLGLAAVLGIVRGHCGAIRVHSEPKRGTTFKLLFPALSEPAVTSRVEKRKDEIAPWCAKGSILVVDDEQAVRTVTEEFLKRAGFEVITAQDGEQAVELFRHHHRTISAVLLDLTMPRMDGLKTFAEMRRIRSNIPVILFSGYSEQQAMSNFDGKGLAGFIQKPVRPKVLLSKLKQILSTDSE